MKIWHRISRWSIVPYKSVRWNYALERVNVLKMAANQEIPPIPFFKGGKRNFLISHQLANN